MNYTLQFLCLNVEGEAGAGKVGFIEQERERAVQY